MIKYPVKVNKIKYGSFTDSLTQITNPEIALSGTNYGVSEIIDEINSEVANDFLQHQPTAGNIITEEKELSQPQKEEILSQSEMF